MIVLAVETATTVCSAAIVKDGQLIAERSIDELYVHTERLMGLIDESLRAGGYGLKEIEGLAVSIGPGSFTGLRIGLSMIKGLSFALDKPIAAVPTLEALADTLVHTETVPTGQCILSVIDARRDEVYAQLFRRDGERASVLWEPRAIRILTLVSMLVNDAVLVTGNGREKFRDALHHDNTSEDNVHFAPDEQARCNAASVGRIGERMLLAHANADPVTLEPMYIKYFHTTARKASG